MAHHKSAQKRIRQTAKRRLENRYYGKTTRNAIRKYMALTEVSEAQAQMGNVISMVDKLAKRNQIHKNKASNIKSKIMLHLNNMKK
ncbi:MAG: 30S ribosomal protein S20 [Sphingobacteriales bacterium]|jgi:small subunit ribosomal protein S20|nr:MAG: 30S ribosomal protein S20 [Sphingobacteriales bacterium]